jgi:hypothetical protein
MTAEARPYGPVRDIAKNEGNLLFAYQQLQTLREITGGIPSLKVLDYGAGLNRYNVTLFSDLRVGQETVAYEPALPREMFRSGGGILNSVSWVNIPPQEGQQFDLVVLSFSMHHMNKQPADVIGDLAKHQPSYIAVSEYDFTEATVTEFKNGFVSEAEQRELWETFGGDWKSCYDYHRKLGKSSYRTALESNRFGVINTEQGEGAARNKFLMVAERKG